MSRGVLQDLDLNLFTVASVDNINFLQRHSFVYSGDQSRSWHGTTTQITQPLTSGASEPRPMDDGNVVVDAQLDMSDMNPSFEVSRHQKRVKRPTPDPSPTKMTRSPEYKKATRRSLSLIETTTTRLPGHSLCVSRRALFSAPTIQCSTHPLSHFSYNHYTPLRSSHSVQEFHRSVEGNRELQILSKVAFLFITLR